MLEGEESAFSVRPVCTGQQILRVAQDDINVNMISVIRNALVIVAAIATVALPAYGHAELGYNLRAVHFEYTKTGMMAYMRFSLALLVANQLGAKNPDGTYISAPYTYNRIESGRVFHYLDIKAVKRDALGLGKLAAQGHDISVAGKSIAAKVMNVRVHPKGSVPPFGKLDDAKNACKGLPYVSAREDEIDSGDVLVDVALLYPQIAAADEFQLKSSLVPGELGEPATKNIFWDHRGNDQQTPYTVEGLIDAAILFSAPKQL